jgi:hypothetical protein
VHRHSSISFVSLILVASLFTACSSSSSPGDSDAGPSSNGNTSNDTSGGDGGACTGTPLPCEGLSFVQCAGSLGCVGTLGSCSGETTPCFELTNSIACGGELDCTWSFQSNTCGGLARSCDEQGSLELCDEYQGCTWTPTSCMGIPLACNQYDAEGCSLVPGCVASE